MSLILDGTGTISGLNAGGLPSATITSTNIASGQTFSLNGVTFPATAVPSADANTLDDYEEGTWTPVITPTSGSVTSYVTNGYYVKVGRTVTITFGFSITNAGTASGRADVSGLPFTTLSPSNFGSGNRAATMIVREDGATGYFYAGYAGGGGTAFQITSLTYGSIIWTAGYGYVTSFVYQSAS